MIDHRDARASLIGKRRTPAWAAAVLAAAWTAVTPMPAATAPGVSPTPSAPPSAYAASSSPAPAPDPALALALLEEDGALRGARVRDALAGTDDPCAALAALAGHPGERVRENAVRSLDELECRSFDHFAGFVRDRSPWVTEAMLRAVENRLLTEAVPFLVGRLDDPRRVIDSDRTRTLGEEAHHVLRALTGHFFGYDPSAPRAERAAAVGRWRRWYEDHRDESRATWVAEGIAQAEAALDGGSSGLRIEALRQLALIGEPAAPTLRAALRRSSGELSADVVCSSDEPPLVTDALDCRLLIQNTTGRRVALVPSAEASITVARLTPPVPEAGSPAKPVVPGRGASKKGSTSKRTGATDPDQDEAPVAVPPRAGRPLDAAMRALAETLVDLAPGEILSRSFKVGPVPAAGRYTVRAALADRADLVYETAGYSTGGGAARPPLEGTTVVRFEQ